MVSFIAQSQQTQTVRTESFIYAQESLIEGLYKRSVISLGFQICLQFLAFFPIVLLCMLIINGCTSAPNVSLSEQTNEITKANAVTPYSKSTFGLYDISTFDIYQDEGFIHALVGGKVSATDKQTTLRYVRSEDGGHNWLAPISLAEFTTTIATRGNDVQLAAKGKHLLAVWQTKGELPGMGPMVSVYSSDNGLTWAKGTNPAANNAGDQSHLDLIADQHGVFHAAWLEDPEENGYQSLRYARSVDGGKYWGKADTLDESTCSCCWNTFALSPEHGLNILYRDMKPRDMALLRLTNDGKTWSKISTAGEFGWQFDGCPHVGGSLAHYGADEPQQLHSLVWTGAEGKSGLYALSSEDNGQTWSTPQKLGDAGVHGDMAVLNGNVFAIWDEMEANGSGIFYAKSQDGGNTWLTPTRLALADRAATHPRLVATELGLLALWTEKPSKQSGRLAWRVIE